MDEPDRISPSAVGRALDAIASGAMFLSAVLMVILIFTFAWLVFGRYVLNATPTWVEQLSLLIVVWIAFLGAAVGVRRGNHLSVEFIREAMPAPLRRFLTVFAVVAMLAFGFVMAWQGYVMYGRVARRVVPLIGVSEGWRAVPIVISGIMIALFSLEQLVSMLRGKGTR